MERKEKEVSLSTFSSSTFNFIIMHEGLISERYAKAVLRYAMELGVADQVYEKMKVYLENYLTHPDLQKALLNPVLSHGDKELLLSTAIGIEPGEVYLRAVRLLIRHHRETYMRTIALMYQKLYRAAYGIVEAKITTAVTQEEAELEKIRQKAREMTGDRIEFSYAVDPSLIGGFVLQLGDRQLDRSVRQELKKIREGLLV